MIRKGRLALCVAVLFLLQVTVAHRFAHGALRADLLSLAAAFLALEADFEGALWGAFVLGFARDLGSCGRLGAGALTLVPLSAALALLKDRLVRESAWTDLALTFTYVMACGLAGAVGAWAFTTGGRLSELLPGAFGQAVFSAALSPLLFAALTAVGLVETTSGSLDAV